MSSAQQMQLARGTPQRPNTYQETPVSQGDIHISAQYFAYETAEGLVSGTTIDVMFTIDRPAREVWPVFKDFTRWQKGHLYSGVLGDIEGKMFYLSADPSAAGVKEPGQKEIRILYQLVKVIPEHLIILSQPVETERVSVFPGLGRVSPGYSVFTLNEHGGKTTITGLMNHASLMQEPGQVMLDEEAIQPWRAMMQEGIRKWRDEFIPDLKKHVHGRR